jgi:hypothetical protein
MWAFRTIVVVSSEHSFDGGIARPRWVRGGTYAGFFLSHFLFRLVPMALVITILATLALPDFMGTFADPVFSTSFITWCHCVHSLFNGLQLRNHFRSLPMNLGSIKQANTRWQSKSLKIAAAYDLFACDSSGRP